MASLSDLKKLPELSYGIHDNTYLTSLKFEGINEVPMFTFKVIQIDPDTKKSLKEANLSMFKPDITKEYVLPSMQQLFVQIHGMLAAAMGDNEKAYKTFDGVVEKTFGDISLQEFNNTKLNKKLVDSVVNDVISTFIKAMAQYTNKEHLVRTKLVMSSSGEWIQIPRRGIFTEPMAVEETTFRFSQMEELNNNKADKLNEETQENED